MLHAAAPASWAAWRFKCITNYDDLRRATRTACEMPGSVPPPVDAENARPDAIVAGEIAQHCFVLLIAASGDCGIIQKMIIPRKTLHSACAEALPSNMHRRGQ
jgi:hypothetical protein